LETPSILMPSAESGVGSRESEGDGETARLCRGDTFVARHPSPVTHHP
jgi:hypothetical protein